jgi:hypothetical protein
LDLRWATNLELNWKDENGDKLAGFHNILNMKKNYFFHLLNVQRLSDVEQIIQLSH